MKDRRQYSRHDTGLQLEVFDLNSQQRIGRVADLSIDGFMLCSEVPIQVDSIIECRLVPAPPLDSIGEISLGADCLWSRPGDGEQHGWAGFHIIDIGDQQLAALERLLQHL